MGVALLARLTVRRVFSSDMTDIFLCIIDAAQRWLPTESCLLFNCSGGACVLVLMQILMGSTPYSFLFPPIYLFVSLLAAPFMFSFCACVPVISDKVLKVCERDILSAASGNFIEFTAELLLGTEINRLDFEVKRSEVRVTTRLNMVKNHVFKNVYWSTIGRRR